ncbi:MAG: carbohydrate kinase family protein, partial [Candidatus Peribacteraceae bacterium]|nr:carbohydrate kinase family protein [Candidatus Peribacteraceae bacterium]
GNLAFTLPLGEKVRVKEVIETCGGGASNSAVGLARLGCNACFEGVIGSDQWGQRLLENMRNEGVDTRDATVVEGEVSSFSIILSASSGERVILYEPGTNAHLHKANFDRDTAKHMDWVYLNHIQEGSSMIQDEIVEILANEDAPRFTWNPGGHQIDVGIESDMNLRLLTSTDFLLLNRDESLRFARAGSVEEAMQKLLKTGVQSIVVTDGKNGADATDGEKRYHCPVAALGPIVDTTGAGDAFGTGMTWALLRGKDFSTALKAGTLNAASVVGAIGAEKGLLTEIQMQELLDRTDLAIEATPL